MPSEEVARITPAHHTTPAQIALAWLLDLAGNVIPIPGTRSSIHLADNLAALDIRLTADERDRLTRPPAAYGSRY